MLTALAIFLMAGCAAAEVQAFPVPEGTPSVEVMFEVTANGQPVGVYSDYNLRYYEVGMGYFNFDPGETVEVKIKPSFGFRTVKILPESLAPEFTVKDGVITFRMDRPGDDLSLVFNNKYQAYAFHLITNPIDHDEEIKNAPNTMYFGPGYHDFTHTELVVPSNTTLYVDAGAVINGPVVVRNARNVDVCGTGLIMMSEENAIDPVYGNIALCLNHAENVTVRDVIVRKHRRAGWTTHIYFSSNVLMENYHVVSTHSASTDAMNISNSQNIEVRNCFLRACDDTVSIKGLGQSETPAGSPPNENIHISGCQLWNDCNNAMVVGEESFAAYYDNISFRDMDVIFSYDDPGYHEKLEERSVMSIVALHGTQIRNILWEDIRVNDCQRLVCFRFLDNFWFGTIQGDQSFPGSIRNVTLRNIQSNSQNDSAICNQILMLGWAADKPIVGVTFENIVINGEKLQNTRSPYLIKNQYVHHLQFK
ncbi:MAG: hypothetical protein E7324_05950 [Clostridiales bacterium]|nr:hypothetical protein [Clostridiales bacterium]